MQYIIHRFHNLIKSFVQSRLNTISHIYKFEDLDEDFVGKIHEGGFWSARFRHDWSAKQNKTEVEQPNYVQNGLYSAGKTHVGICP